MAESPFHIAELITAYIQDTLSPEQRAALDKWLELNANKRFLKDFSHQENFREKLAQFAGTNEEATWNKTLKRLAETKQIHDGAKAAPAYSFPLMNYKWIAVAAVVAVIGLFAYFFKPFGMGISQDGESTKVVALNDVSPGTKGATLTLANGRTIELSGEKNGVSAKASTITYDDGTLVDSSWQEEPMKHAQHAAFLLASTANGKTYMFTLPDGTKVWLNAASSIKFPSTFAGERRRVEISGEAYLEVFKDKAHPFIVVSKDQELEVLGTHFNLRSYAEENSTKTTLLEGAVKIASRSSFQTNKSVTGGTKRSAVVLKPNEQSVLMGGAIKVQATNTNMETAWMKNDFYFRVVKLENLLQEVARWYNVKVMYADEDIKSIPLSGQISRAKALSVVLERIASAGHVRFKIEGKQVTVMPDNH